MKQQQKISKGIQIIICVFILIFGNDFKSLAQCDISIISAEPYCSYGSTFITFEIDESIAADFDDFFTVNFGGIEVGTYQFGSSNYTVFISNDSGQTAGLYVFVDGQDCFDEVDVELPDCPNQCIFYNQSAFATCNLDGTIKIDYLFYLNGGNESGYDLFIDGVFYDYYPTYPTQVITIENYVLTQNDGPVQVTFSDNDNPDCSVTINASDSALDCLSDACISNLEVTFGDCIPNGNVNVIVDFDYINVQGGWFLVESNGGEYFGTWDNLPFEFSLPGDEEFYDIVVTDGNNANCFAETEILTPYCESLPCSITNLQLSSAGCNGTYAGVIIDFDYENTPNDYFTISSYGLSYTFTYSSLPITWYGLPGDGETIYDITITDNTNQDCSAEGEVFIADCGADVCNIEISNIEVGCDGYIPYVYYDAETVDDGATSYNLFANGVLQGTFNYGLAFSFNHNLFNASGTVLLEWVGSPGCYFQTTIEIPPACAEYCNFQITSIESYCNFNSQFVEFEIATQNVGINGFEAFYDNTSLGTYQYGEPNYTIQLPYGIYSDQIYLYDVDSTDCVASYDVIPLDCDACTIGVNDLEAGCDGDVITLTYWLTSNEDIIDYDVFIDGTFIATINFIDGALQTIYLNGITETGNYTFTIEGDGDCFHESIITIQDDCSEVCELGVPIAESYCVNGIAYVDFEVDYNNTNNIGFDVLIDGIFIDSFEYGETYYTIELPEDINIYALWIYDIDNDGCNWGADIPLIDCENDCQFMGLNVETICDDYTGNFNYIVSFDPQNEGTNGFTIVGNGNNYGTFSYMDLPINFGELIGDDSFVPELIIQDVDNPNCQIIWEGDPVGCIIGGQCFISDISISNECNDDDEVFVSLDFIAQNTLNYGFDVWINNVFIDSYQYTDLPLELGPLMGDGLTPYLIEFADVADPTCTASIELSEISCVWAGDGNFDKIVNNYDLLNIGLAYGYAGEQRLNADIDFDAEPAESWDASFVSGINHKHADCNGNGEVSMLDAEAIDQNYNQVHGKTTSNNLGSAEDPPLYIDLPEGSLIGGTELEIPIVLGSIDFPVDSIYGLAFTIEYNPNIIDSTSVEVMFGDSWFAPESLQISLTKEIETGFVDAAISRIDHLNVTGSGEIGVMSLVLLENIEGKTTIPLQIEITNVKAIRHSEDEITLNTNAESVEVINIINYSLPSSIEIYPNPATDYLIVNSIENIELSIFSSEGKLLINENSKKINQVDISHLETGVYLLKLENQSANYFEKLIIR